MKRNLGIVASVVLLAACIDWVPLTPEGEKVRVANAAEVAGCKELGNVTGKVKVTVGPLARDERKIAGEIEALARNEAVSLGANTLVPTGPVDWDHRSYAAFRCEGLQR